MKRNIALIICASIISSSIFGACSDISQNNKFSPKTIVDTMTTDVPKVSPSVLNNSLSDKDGELTSVQENSIAWLNYLAMLSQEIDSSKNSRLYLEEAYAALINNTNPENVDEPTESQLVSLLDIIEKYRIINVKRERLQYLYEQNQAKALKEAVPNPVALLSATSTLDPKKMVAAIVYMAVDSISSYESYNNEINQEYLKDGWELDDEAAENLHDNRKRAFQYMIEIVRQYHLPGDLALSESAIQKFVDCKNSQNTHQKIQFLESNKKTYEAFGNYWLLLSECYYDNKEYSKCLECFDEYENLHSRIFRKDYNLAKHLPLAIAAASEVQNNKTYIGTAERYSELIMQNTESDEWALRYFVAEIYVDLYSKTNDEKYLRSAYNILLDNVNHLVNEQNKLNQIYINDVQEVEITKDATKEDKQRTKEYNKNLNEKRKTELPSIYEPLAINCDFLFSLADKINISQQDKDRIDGILSGNDIPSFLTNPIRKQFSFKKSGNNDNFVNATYDKNKLILPVSCLSESASIKVTVTNGPTQTIYDDWIIEKVERPKNASNYMTFYATYTSKSIKDYQWTANSLVKVEIYNGDYSHNEPTVINFNVSEYKVRFLIDDYIKFTQVI